MTWTGARENQLRQLCGEGLSAAQIASRMKCTKGCVVGKMQRLGLSSGQAPVAVTHDSRIRNAKQQALVKRWAGAL